METARAAEGEPATTGSLPAATSEAMRPSSPAAIAVPMSLALGQAGFAADEVSLYREGIGFIRGTRAAVAAYQQPLPDVAKRDVAAATACRDALVPAATALGASDVLAGGAGPSRRTRDGISVPLEMRILYKGPVGYEVRQATVTCDLDRDGQVVALTEAASQAAPPQPPLGNSSPISR
jgi:hypothetical protein